MSTEDSKTNEVVAQDELAQDKSMSNALSVFEFDWLKNEALLRDEGAYYGLVSEEVPEEKLNTIDSFFNEFIARIEKSIELQEEELIRVQGMIGKVETEIDALEAEIDAGSTAYIHEPNIFWRLITGIIAYLIIGFFVFWLPFELFGPNWRTPFFITLGVFLFGLISHYHRPSWWYETKTSQQGQSRLDWKTLFEELGIPFVATLFIVVWGNPRLSALHLISYALILFVFFVFVGKGLLDYLSQLSPNFKILKENRQKNKHRVAGIAQNKEKLLKKQETLKDLHARSLEIGESKIQRTLEVAQLHHKKETYKNYFLSEFRLAKESRKHLILENTLGNRYG